MRSRGRCIRRLRFLSFPQDAEDNRKWIAVKLVMPVLAVGGARSFGAEEAVVMRNAAVNVTEVVSGGFGALVDGGGAAGGDGGGGGGFFAWREIGGAWMRPS